MNPDQQKLSSNIAAQMSGVKNPKDDVGEPNAANAAAVAAGATASGWQPSKWKANLASAFSPSPEPEAAPAARPLTQWQQQVLAAREAAAAAGK